MTLNLTISPTPVAGISINDVCFKDSARFNNTSTVRLGKIASNKWYFGDGDSSTAFHPAHFYKDSGVYYISLTTTTDSGCFASVKDTIKKYPRFDLGFSHLDTCVGFDLNFTNTTTSDGGILHDWAWLFHDGTEKNTYGSTFNYTTAGTYDVQLSVVQDTFCYDTIIKQVVVDPDVTADFTFSGGCLSDTVRFTATSSVPSGSVAVNSWTLGDGFTATGDSAKVKYTSKGSKSVTLISSSGAGCSDTVSKNVLIKNPRILDMSNPLICDGQAAKVYGIYNLDNDTITNWDWASDGITNTLDTFVITNPVVGKFEVELIIRTKNNCTAVFYDSVTVYPNPIADFTVSPICEGTNFVIVNNSSIGSPGVISNQRWFKNGTQVSTSANPSIMATPPGTTTLRLLLTSDKNCTHEISKDVEVYANPVANFNFVNTCLGETTAFTDNSTISLGSISTRNWLFSTGNMATGSTASETFATVGSKTAILEVVSNNDCRDTIQKTIVIDPKPSIVISANKYDGCVPFTPTFVNACTIASGTIDTYNWDFGDGATSSGNAPTHTYTSLGFFDIQVIGTSDKGCKDTALTPSQIEVLAAPVADFSYSPQDPSLLFPGVTFTNISSPDAATFKWYISDGTSYSSNDVNHTFLTTGDFDVTLVAEAANGCLDTILQTVKVKADFFIYAPSTFTPNGDNLNDVFKIYGIIPDVKGYSLMIIDRWGGMIFNSTNTAEYWDGTVQGVPVPNGMYAFSARYINIETGHFEVLNGMVSVMR
ncbi:MAG: gliding motility-associated-like protein [Bacteroidia bacterium]|jgi:gliding motility-associated-like protein